MISYEPFFNALEKRGISQDQLINDYQISADLLHRMRKNQDVSMYSIDRICHLLQCRKTDVMEHVQDSGNTHEKDENLKIDQRR